MPSGSISWTMALAQRTPRGTVECREKSVAGGFDLAGAMLRQDGADDAPVFFQQFNRAGFIALGQRAEPHHVGKHDGGELAMFGIWSRHGGIKPKGREK